MPGNVYTPGYTCQVIVLSLNGSLLILSTVDHFDIICLLVTHFLICVPTVITDLNFPWHTGVVIIIIGMQIDDKPFVTRTHCQFIKKGVSKYNI